MISVFLNLPRPPLWPSMRSILKNVPCALEKNVYSDALYVLQISIKSTWSNYFPVCELLTQWVWDLITSWGVPSYNPYVVSCLSLDVEYIFLVGSSLFCQWLFSSKLWFQYFHEKRWTQVLLLHYIDSLCILMYYSLLQVNSDLLPVKYRNLLPVQLKFFLPPLCSYCHIHYIFRLYA